MSESTPKKTKSIDRRIFIAAAILLILVSLTFGLYTFLGKSGRDLDGKEIIAELTTHENDVKFKEEGKFAWSPVQKNQHFINRDSIFTGSKSKATLKFHDDSIINVAENSVIVVEKSENGILARIELGSFEGVIGNKLKLQVVDSNNIIKDIVAGSPNTKIKIKINDNNDTKDVVISVLRGVASLNGKDGAIKISPKKSYTFKKKKEKVNPKSEDKTNSITIISPKNRSKVWENEEQSVDFKWEDTNRQDGDKYTITVSEQINLTKRPLNITTSKNSANLKNFPINKKLYWTITKENNQGNKRIINSFTITENPIPELLTPENYTKLEEESNDISFSWKDSENASTFEFQLVKEIGNKTELMANQTVSGTRYSVKNIINDAAYMWRVKVKEKNRHGKWSDYFHISKPAIDLTSTPLPIDPISSEASGPTIALSANALAAEQEQAQNKANELTEEQKEKIRRRKEMIAKKKELQRIKAEQLAEQEAKKKEEEEKEDEEIIAKSVDHFEQQKNRKKSKFRFSMFYAASKGTLKEKVSNLTVENSQNSPVTLGAFLSYKVKENMSVSGSTYISNLAEAREENDNTIPIPYEYGANIYYNYKYSKILSPYGGLDYEGLSIYNTEELLGGATLKASTLSMLYLTAGTSVFFKLLNKQWLFKGSYSYILNSSGSTSKFSGSKFILYLSMNFTDNIFIHILAKHHMLSGATKLDIYRYGIGLGFHLF